MAFSQSGISLQNIQAAGPEFFVRWTSSAPHGTCFQVYVDGRLNWSGTSRLCYVPIPAGAAGRNVWVDVATVAVAEARVDFSSELASSSRGGGGAVRISWMGGTYLDPSGRGDVQGFHLYRSPAAGLPIDFTAPIAEVAAYHGGPITDGFGLGGFGLGGFGQVSTSHAWSTGGLSGGLWHFAVVPFDREGNDRGSGQTVSVTVHAAPRPPGLRPDKSRLDYTYSGPQSRLVTLAWAASPSATVR